MIPTLTRSFFFLFNHPATTELYTLSLHDALPIWPPPRCPRWSARTGSTSAPTTMPRSPTTTRQVASASRSEEHTSELQSLRHLVCRLLLEKKKKKVYDSNAIIMFQESKD